MLHAAQQGKSTLFFAFPKNFEMHKQNFNAIQPLNQVLLFLSMIELDHFSVATHCRNTQSLSTWQFAMTVLVKIRATAPAK